MSQYESDVIFHDIVKVRREKILVEVYVCVVILGLSASQQGYKDVLGSN